MSAPGCVGVVHVHSDYSADGRDSLEQLRAFALERGIAFIGLTDHAEHMRPAVDRLLYVRARVGHRALPPRVR